MVTWIETTEERYDDMLGAVPPASMDGRGAFLLGEPYSDRGGKPTFHAFKREKGVYYASSEPVTFAEFKADRPTAQYYYC